MIKAEDLKSEIETKSRIEATATKQFACHSVWVGPNELPVEAVLSLYEKFDMYLKQVKGSNQTDVFLPTLCLGMIAAQNLFKSSVTIKLVKLDECPHDCIKTAARNLGDCSFVLRIDLGGSKEPGFIPVLLWQDLQNTIKKKLGRVVTEELESEDSRFKKRVLRKGGENQRCLEEGRRKGYFFEDEMFNFLDGTIKLLGEQQQYVAASKIIRLLLLAVKPGCYVDISGMALSKIPCTGDIPVPFLTRKDQNDFIICIDSKIAIQILMIMYAGIREYKEENPERYAKLPSISEKLGEQQLTAVIKLHAGKLTNLKTLETVVCDSLDRDKIDLSGYLRARNWYVKRVAGGDSWDTLRNRFYCFYSDGYEAPSEEEETLKRLLQPAFQSESLFGHSDRFWKKSAFSLVERLRILSILFKDEELYGVAEREISNLSEQYEIDRLEVIRMSVVVVLGLINSEEIDQMEIKDRYEATVSLAKKIDIQLGNYKKRKLSPTLSSFSDQLQTGAESCSFSPLIHYYWAPLTLVKEGRPLNWNGLKKLRDSQVKLFIDGMQEATLAAKDKAIMTKTERLEAARAKMEMAQAENAKIEMAIAEIARTRMAQAEGLRAARAETERLKAKMAGAPVSSSSQTTSEGQPPMLFKFELQAGPEKVLRKAECQDPAMVSSVLESLAEECGSGAMVEELSRKIEKKQEMELSEIEGLKAVSVQTGAAPVSSSSQATSEGQPPLLFKFELRCGSEKTLGEIQYEDPTELRNHLISLAKESGVMVAQVTGPGSAKPSSSSASSLQQAKETEKAQNKPLKIKYKF